MPDTFSGFELTDLRFPTSRDRAGSDAMNPDPDYSAAYLKLPTGSGDAGYGFVFTIGRGNDIQVAAIPALERQLVGRSVDDVLTNLGAVWRELTGDSQLRWLGPDKGVVQMAVGAVVNALWDWKARRAGLPLWRLLAELDPAEIVELVDFTYLEDALTAAEALAILQAGRRGAAERTTLLLATGYPAYTTSAGWLGYPDEKVVRLAVDAVEAGFDHLKLKVGADIDDDIRRCELVRATVGPDIRISIDANQRWGVTTAIEHVRRLAHVDLWWVEEPTSPDDILGHKAIREAVAPVRVATGEHCANRVMFKQLLSSGAVDVCQIYACRVAGVNENIAILLMAAKFGVPGLPARRRSGAVRGRAAPLDVRLRRGERKRRGPVDGVRRSPERAHYRAPYTPGSGARIHDATLEGLTFPGGAAWSTS